VIGVHEYSIVSELITLVEAEARRRGAEKVHRVVVKLGARSGVERTLFTTAFETFRERTICDGASLELELTSGAELLLQRVEIEVADV
jgi:hydrogenase nickel incorporation protein HypA/HybF